MSDFVERLDLNAHRRLEKALGYNADRRWVAWHWEPQINQVTYTDGETLGSANSPAWQVFLEHPGNRQILGDYDLTQTDQTWLLLDRKTRNIYVGDGKVIEGLLDAPESLELLADLDNEVHPLRDLRYTITNPLVKWKKSRSLRYLFTLLPIGAGAALIAALGVNVWSSLIPRLEQNLRTDTPISSSPVLSNTSCGVDGTRDFSAFVTSSNSDRELHLIGVYEANANHTRDNNSTGTIDVKIDRQDKPIILALSSYEPVIWNLNLEPDVVIEKIIVNGYHTQQITGVNNIPIQQYTYEQTGQSLGSFVYKWDDNSQVLVEPLTQITGTTLTSFQGCYRGTEFQIN